MLGKLGRHRFAICNHWEGEGSDERTLSEWTIDKSQIFVVLIILDWLGREEGSKQRFLYVLEWPLINTENEDGFYNCPDPLVVMFAYPSRPILELRFSAIAFASNR